MAKTVDVAPEQKISSAWGNEVRDRTVQLFASVAERDASGWAPPNGAVCVTQDTYTLWLRVAGAWAAKHPFAMAGNASVTTDGFGNFQVNLPAGGKLLGASGNGAQTAYPSLVLVNYTDGPVGAGYVIFNIRNPAGAPWANTLLTISYVILYTM
jgi:hypothetical protein